MFLILEGMIYAFSHYQLLPICSTVVGQFVSATATKPYGISGMGYGLSRESREVSIETGRRVINQIASILNLGHHIADSAHRLYILAVESAFTQGRRTSHVAASCLYTICRRERHPILLIDFAEKLRVNLYVLGACFLKFARQLNIVFPLVDPSLYIHRFAARLDLGNKTHAVSMTAMRLVSRMKRDWIETGRRPAGICGACLLIAARVHGFKRSIAEVMTVVRITETTLRNRLAEFEATAASSLSPEEFEQTDDSEILEAADPPSYTRNLIEEEFLKESALLQRAYLQDMMGDSGKFVDYPTDTESVAESDPSIIPSTNTGAKDGGADKDLAAATYLDPTTRLNSPTYTQMFGKQILNKLTDGLQSLPADVQAFTTSKTQFEQRPENNTALAVIRKRQVSNILDKSNILQFNDLITAPSGSDMTDRSEYDAMEDEEDDDFRHAAMSQDIGRGHPFGSGLTVRTSHPEEGFYDDDGLGPFTPTALGSGNFAPLPPASTTGKAVGVKIRMPGATQDPAPMSQSQSQTQAQSQSHAQAVGNAGYATGSSGGSGLGGIPAGAEKEIPVEFLRLWKARLLLSNNWGQARSRMKKLMAEIAQSQNKSNNTSKGKNGSGLGKGVSKPSPASGLETSVFHELLTKSLEIHSNGGDALNSTENRSAAQSGGLLESEDNESGTLRRSVRSGRKQKQVEKMHDLFLRILNHSAEQMQRTFSQIDQGDQSDQMESMSPRSDFAKGNMFSSVLLLREWEDMKDHVTTAQVIGTLKSIFLDTASMAPILAKASNTTTADAIRPANASNSLILSMLLADLAGILTANGTNGTSGSNGATGTADAHFASTQDAGDPLGLTQVDGDKTTSAQNSSTVMLLNKLILDPNGLRGMLDHNGPMLPLGMPQVPTAAALQNSDIDWSSVMAGISNPLALQQALSLVPNVSKGGKNNANQDAMQAMYLKIAIDIASSGKATAQLSGSGTNTPVPSDTASDAGSRAGSVAVLEKQFIAGSKGHEMTVVAANRDFEVPEEFTLTNAGRRGQRYGQFDLFEEVEQQKVSYSDDDLDSSLPPKKVEDQPKGEVHEIAKESEQPDYTDFLNTDLIRKQEEVLPVDESELEDYFLDETETVKRREVWRTMNRAYIESAKRKGKQKRSGTGKREKGSSWTPGTNPAESASNMVSANRSSQKVNALARASIPDLLGESGTYHSSDHLVEELDVRVGGPTGESSSGISSGVSKVPTIRVTSTAAGPKMKETPSRKMAPSEPAASSLGDATHGEVASTSESVETSTKTQAKKTTKKSMQTSVSDKEVGSDSDAPKANKRHRGKSVDEPEGSTISTNKKRAKVNPVSPEKSSTKATPPKTKVRTASQNKAPQEPAVKEAAPGASEPVSTNATSSKSTTATVPIPAKKQVAKPVIAKPNIPVAPAAPKPVPAKRPGDEAKASTQKVAAVPKPAIKITLPAGAAPDGDLDLNFDVYEEDFVTESKYPSAPADEDDDIGHIEY